ncbi:helix-turn-helix domain protein [bacterium BMS3Bbin13]|nr:helix-turn-helix domain protein [bacterium BMS3Bbin13]
MAKKYAELRAKMAPSARARSRVRAREILDQMPLFELRQARRLSQERLAEVLRVKQASISKLEHRTDVYVSTLRSYIEALGGTLEIVASFPDGAVRITQFEAIKEGQVAKENGTYE